MSAAPAGADSVTVVMDAGWQRSEKVTVRLSGDIAKRPRAKKPTAKLKIAADIGWVKKIKKTWMMQLQHGYHDGVCSYLTLSGIDFLLNRISDGAIFVPQMVWWWMNFPAAAMATQGS